MTTSKQHLDGHHGVSPARSCSHGPSLPSSAVGCTDLIVTPTSNDKCLQSLWRGAAEERGRGWMPRGPPSSVPGHPGCSLPGTCVRAQCPPPGDPEPPLPYLP